MAVIQCDASGVRGRASLFSTADLHRIDIGWQRMSRGVHSKVKLHLLVNDKTYTFVFEVYATKTSDENTWSRDVFPASGVMARRVAVFGRLFPGYYVCR